jgi:hypothetical protein
VTFGVPVYQITQKHGHERDAQHLQTATVAANDIVSASGVD